MKKVFLLFFLIGSMAMAQTAYVNSDYLLASMTEMQAANAEIQKLNKSLGSDLQKAEANAKQKLADLQYKASAPGVTEEQMKQYASQADALQKELESSAQSAERTLGLKRQELLDPILERVNDAIEAVAKEKGFKLVVNASAVLFADESVNLTPAVAAKLGVTLK
ncbi:outer membrane protein H precursor [Nonlabens tegetincola]|uniref:Outer membrane protein H n=1 Tax=Nonlabens tegetincola TaxID=323273 RepID=A0A090Q2X4_9FLAO|nr:MULTISPECIES: OmpH family outer membrane protein [Nonlabens]ALM20357.1 hypothetical protein AAT17_03465 [Nonlabens sp. MIC269]ARN70581.1 hypothetical protein BST91_02355 [Nonlabens tegetincola]MEE2802684.1 OmpH family outer membrane protein [Bacteroidota bacterium]GAK97434.1 outer membrane protein H precursor [Nonlabens tegetincola]